MTCSVCGSEASHPTFEVLEMQFGTREAFPYFQCVECGCLQIASIPEDMGPYYPDELYSGEDAAVTALMDTPLPNWCVATMLGGPIVSFAELQRRPPGGWEREAVRRVLEFYLGDLGIDTGARVLDVGTADGSFLQSLRKAGFTGRLHGVDPLLHNSLKHDAEDVVVQKTDLLGVAEEPCWDLITFHHTLECVPRPREVFRGIAARLAADGVCMIRSHTVPSYAWERFGVHWVGIDAPRNFFLYSPQSLRILAEQAGLRLEKVRYDSTAFQFWGSLQYTKDCPIYSDDSLVVNPERSGFPLERLAVFEQSAKALNRQDRGDQAAFYFAHA